MRTCIKDAFERYHIDIIVDAKSPETGEHAVGKYDVYMDWDKVATGEDWYCLDESVEGVEGKSSEGRYSFGFVVDCVEVAVDGGVVQQSVGPVCEELVIDNMEEEVEQHNWSKVELVLYFGVVRVAQFDETDQRGLPENVEH